MPQSFCQIYLHVVFSTKDRLRWLDDSIRGRVHAYLATLARDSGCPFVHIGGTDDHIHVLADLGKKTAAVPLIGKLKQESSKFVKTLGPEYKEFYWQFQEEYRAFLERYDIKYDEQYMWE